MLIRMYPENQMMTSEQPDKYVYCENENNLNVVFFQIPKVFGLDLISEYFFPCKEKIAKS